MFKDHADFFQSDGGDDFVAKGCAQRADSSGGLQGSAGCSGLDWFTRFEGRFEKFSAQRCRILADATSLRLEPFIGLDREIDCD